MTVKNVLQPISGHMTLRRVAKEAWVTPGSITLAAASKIKELLLEAWARVNRGIVKSTMNPDEINWFRDIPPTN